MMWCSTCWPNRSSKRKDAFDQYTKAGRDDLAKVEAEEMVQLEQYLPKPLSDGELSAAIDKAIADLGASGMQDMGKGHGRGSRRIQGTG